MSAEPVAVLQSTRGDAVPLKAVSAHGRLEGLLFELSVEQRYENTGTDNLEAVFTFPLPLRAVLLGFDLTIGERKLSAVATARPDAIGRYEKAIDSGDTAALIEHDGHGLYTVSLGNLLAGETATIRYRYAELLDAHEGHVRLNVPTVIAPRYGDPRDAGLEGPAVPDVDILGEYPFSITLDLVGLTDATAVRSPSHAVTTTEEEGGLIVRLSRTGFLDRDFVLELDAAAIPQGSLVTEDGDGFVMLTSATLALDAQEQRPLVLKLLLDCSGSMGGASIAAAKRALLAILERLTPTDQISLTRFGSSVEEVTEGLEPANEHTLIPLRARVRQLDADLGGTEMEGAIEEVLAISVRTPSTRPDLILITDGEIYDVEQVIGRAAQSGQRLFAIAIGAAPNEALARALAEKTGGACEFVGSHEDAEAAILRTFKRLRFTPRTLFNIDWPATPAWTAPLPNAVFPGDTLHLLAGFNTQPVGNTTLTIRDPAAQGTTIHVPTSAKTVTGDLIPRLAAARRLATLDREAAVKLAVQYQLATEHTSFIVVAARAEGEKARDLPNTIAVPHMLAAGWGATAAQPERILASMSADFATPLRAVAAPASLRARPRGPALSRSFEAQARGVHSRRFVAPVESDGGGEEDRHNLLLGPRNVQPYIERKGEQYMGKEQLEHFRQILLAWKQDLMDEIERASTRADQWTANPPDPNDSATLESEFALELRTCDRELKLIRKIDEALKRIEDGTYGYCLETGEPIGIKRLEARPIATLCIEAQERRERREKQYGDRDGWYR